MRVTKHLNRYNIFAFIHRESHGLDESLIISKSVSNNFLREDSSSGDISQENQNFRSIIEEQHPPEPPAPKVAADPTFIRTMEHSKFSSLVKEEHSTSKHDYHMVKSTSSDTPMSLGTPVSASEVAAALLGASTSSLCGFRNRHRRIEEEDLSTPYNHYKCLSPKDRVGKLLRRQFSLDRTEEVSNECIHVSIVLILWNYVGYTEDK